MFPIRPEDGASYLGSMNVEITADGMTPAFDHGDMSGSADRLHYFSSVVNAKNPSGNPRMYAAVNDKVLRYEGGAIAQDVDFEDVLQSLLIMDDDQTPPNERLIAFFGDSTAIGASGGHAWRNLGSDSGGGFSGAWNKHTGATAIQAWQSERVGSDAFLVTGSQGAGRTALGEHKVAKIVSGLYDGETTDIGPGEPVGMSDWPVITLAGFRDSVLAGKGPGAFYRNNRNLAYEPLRQLLENLPHGLNCKAMIPSENGIIFSTVDGGLWEWDGATLREITPLRDHPKAKDTNRGRIEFLADRGDVLVAGYAIAQPYIPGPVGAALGIRVFKRVAGTWAEITSGLTDGDLETPVVANMNAWGGTATDRLLVLSPFPLAGFIPRVTRGPNGNNNAFATPTGTDTNGDFDAVSLGNLIDATILGTATRSLVLTGFPPAAAEPIVSWDSKSAFYDVIQSSVTLTGIGTITGMYGYAVRPTNSTAMSAGTTIDEMDFIAARPGLKLNDAAGPFVAANDFSSLWASGMVTELYFGKRRGFGQYDWSIPYAVFTKGGVLKAAWTAAAAGALTNGGMTLALLGRFRQMQVAEGATRDPRRTRYPRLCQWTTTEPGPRLTINEIAFRHSDGSAADPGQPKKIRRVTLHTRDVPKDDVQQVWIDGLDGRPPSKFGTGQGTNPIVIANGAGPTVRRATLHLLYSDTNQTDLWAPLVERIEVEWEYIDAELLRDAPPEAVAVV